MLAQEIANSEPCHRGTPTIDEHGLAGQVLTLDVPAHDDLLEKMGGAGPGRAEPDLVALAVQPNLARQVETQVADPQVTLRSEVSYSVMLTPSGSSRPTGPMPASNSP